MFTGCLGLDSLVPIKIVFAHRVGYVEKRRDRSRDVLVWFVDWSTKTAVLEALWDKPKNFVKGQELAIFSDLSPITLKIRELRFLIVKLAELGIPYRVSKANCDN